ncbi:cytochrome c biogenesis protein ResB [Streptomyces sp. NPDC015140]|uniref:cytochrome c biogenesis protein ResB n=1 Tax=Streptomyces TaxID=1883 RepID=UPI0036FAFABE
MPREPSRQRCGEPISAGRTGGLSRQLRRPAKTPPNRLLVPLAGGQAPHRRLIAVAGHLPARQEEPGEEFKGSDGKLFKQQLKVSDTMNLPGGAVSVTFDGVQEWAGFQVTRPPGSGWALSGAVVEVAGLGRSESAKVPAELGDLSGVRYNRAPAAPENPATPESTDTHAVTAEETEKK